MNRRSFLKRLGIGALLIPVIGISDSPKQEQVQILPDTSRRSPSFLSTSSARRDHTHSVGPTVMYTLKYRWD